MHNPIKLQIQRNRYLIVTILYITSVFARGPHHPKSSHMKLKTDKHFQHEKQ